MSFAGVLLSAAAQVLPPATLGGGAAAAPTLAMTLGKALLPLGAYVALAPLLWVFFRKTWRELDLEAHEHQGATLVSGGFNFRPAVLFAITALMLTLQEYYGGRDSYDQHIRPWLRGVEQAQALTPGGLGEYVDLRRYGELYAYTWWSLTRVLGYVVVPLALWKLIFREDRLLDMGLRFSGVRQHAPIYLLCLVAVVPVVVLVSYSPDFGAYYPFYKHCSRSIFDLVAWEVLYIAQFFALEVFFRGFWLAGLRTSLGSGAIFAMCVPYCMIHFGKPYLEAAGAVIAGVALGSLAMKTRSIYWGFLVHVTVALLMDLLALSHKGGLPTAAF